MPCGYIAVSGFCCLDARRRNTSANDRAVGGECVTGRKADVAGKKKKARAFLQASKSDPGVDADRLALAQRIAKHQAPIQLDGTMRLLMQLGLPLTRENYLRLAFAGNPPEEPLDGEIEAELPLGLQIADINNAPSAGDCGEPDHTTLRGFPSCSRCGRSTRNKNALVCASCRNRTRMVLTDEDKKFLREIGISRWNHRNVAADLTEHYEHGLQPNQRLLPLQKIRWTRRTTATSRCCV